MSELFRDEEFVHDTELLFGPETSPDSLDDPVAAPPPPAVPPPLPRHSQFSRAPAKREVTPFRAGEVLAGKYRVERVLGRAGIGVVVHVRHVELGQPLLLKCLPSEACGLPDAVARFLSGARAAMRLGSEHTARTIDAGRLPSGLPYVVSESYVGSDLGEILRVRGALVPSEAVDFVLQTAEAVAEAHALGIVHKSLNLSTLFVTRRPDGAPLIKVHDFGVADALRPDPLRIADMGSESSSMFDSNPLIEALACLSPEQIRNWSEIDSRADIWALGAILHQLLSGYPAYQANTISGLLASIAADPAPPVTSVRSDVPAQLETAILRCLEKDRGARYPSLADLASALQRFASTDAQGAAERITRTLGRTTSRPPTMSAAMVHIGPGSLPPPAARARAGANASLVRYPLVWSTLLLTLGLLGGTVAGVLIATRSSAEREANVEQIIGSEKSESAMGNAAPTAAAPAASSDTSAQPASARKAPTQVPASPVLPAKNSGAQRAARVQRAAADVDVPAPNGERTAAQASVESLPSKPSESPAVPKTEVMPKKDKPGRGSEATASASLAGKDLFDSVR